MVQCCWSLAQCSRPQLLRKQQAETGQLHPPQPVAVSPALALVVASTVRLASKTTQGHLVRRHWQAAVLAEGPELQWKLALQVLEGPELQWKLVLWPQEMPVVVLGEEPEVQ